ncbi:hypothetical protein DL95DRAFT_82487 [Leptodontidium sp. 2 PMI_412]|nr:hypothetical protein DL95DRAFT_82487 [Leptodontidium sp. 2 PMI_412]
MQLPMLCLVVFCISCISAIGEAKAYERIWIYYAYLLDVKGASLGAPRSILPTRGPNLSFRDVMEIIALNQVDRNRVRNINLPAEPHPSVETAFQALWGGSVAGKYEPRAVISGLAGGYTEMIWRIGAITNENKRLFSEADRAEMAEISGLQDKSLRLAKLHRAVEVDAFIWRVKDNKFPGIELVRDRTEAGWLISWEQTEARNGGGDEVRATIKSYLDAYFSGDEDARGHRYVHDAMDFAYNVQREISCGD